MALIKEQAKSATLVASKGGKRKLIIERLRKITKADERNDWFNLIALMILLGITIAFVVFYFNY